MAAARAYVDFVPPHSLLEEPDKLTLRVDLSAEGFKKEQLRVQIDNRGRLSIGGERPPAGGAGGGKQWKRFRKDFAVPEGCNASAVRAKLEKDGFLCITMPRLSTATAEEPTANTGGVADQDQKAGDASPRQAGAPAADTQAEEEGGQEGDAGAASMEGRPGQDEQAQDTSSNAGAAAAAAAGQPAYGFARERRSRMVWAILAFVLALVVAGLYARYRLVEPSAEPAPESHPIVSLSDS